MTSRSNTVRVAASAWRRPSQADPQAFASFVERAAGQPLRPYEILDPVRRPSLERFKTMVERNFYGTWHMEGVQLPSIHPPVAWKHLGRSNQYSLQSWTAVSILLAAHGLSGRLDYRDMAVAYAEDWLRTFQLPAFKRTPADAVAPARKDADFVWADKALGLRAHRLAYVFDLRCREVGADPALLDLYFDALHYHVEALLVPGAFSRYSNHGLYQALGLLALCRRFDWYPPFGVHAAAARTLLAQSLDAQFTPDGAHLEHSPGCLFGVMATLLGARDCGLLEESPAAEAVAARAEEAASAMLLPDGRIASFGETDFQPSAPYGPGDRFRDKELIFMLSRGAAGRAPVSGIRAFPGAGYAFARIHNGNPSQASYLAQMGGFHSRVHKQADHLTFIWAEGPMAILTDPGRYGYEGKTQPGSELHKKGFQYSDPKRIYMESTHAHNCVEIDGESHGRDEKIPFGSALRQADIQDGLVVFDFEVRHAKAVRQVRTLILSPNQYLLVVDWLQSDVEDAHDFRQWFKMAPDWTATVVEGNAVSASRDQRAVWAVDLLGAPVSEIWRGASNPLRGWLSPKGGEFVPAPSFHFSRLQTPETAFATLFLLDGWAEPNTITRVEAFAEAATFAFTTAGQTVEIEYRRDDRVAVKRTVR